MLSSSDRYRTGLRTTAALASLLALGSCQEPEPTAFEPHPAQTTLFMKADFSGTPVATIVVVVTAPDIARALAFNIPIPYSLVASTLTVPAGSNRTITLRAYDAGAALTYSGSTTVNIQQGTNPTIAIVLTPVADEPSITVTLAGLAITVQPAVDTLIPGDTLGVAAHMVDGGGEPVTGQVSWATLTPAVATVVSTGQQTGRVTAVGPGQATIVATYGGIAGPAVITVTALPSDEPVFAAGTDTVLWSDNFDSYTSVDSMTSGTVPNNMSAGNVLLSPGRNGTGKALRADYSLADVNQDGGQSQRSINWLSPWNIETAMSTYTPATAKIVVQFWFRFSAGATPDDGGTKWVEYYLRDSRYRWQSGIDGTTGGGWDPYVIPPPPATRGEVFSFNNSGSPTDANGHLEQAQQPVGPWISDINDGNWHRWTALLQASSAPGAGDGMFRAWIDGTKIMDLSASAVGVTPPGGRKPWCYAGETVVIPADPIGYLQFPGVANNIVGALYTLDHDDLVIWKQEN